MNTELNLSRRILQSAKLTKIRDSVLGQAALSRTAEQIGTGIDDVY